METAEPVESAAPVAAETAEATATDQDADNLADAQEAQIGLDASNPDTDGDGVADGDEGTLYGTDPSPRIRTAMASPMARSSLTLVPIPSPRARTATGLATERQVSPSR